MQDRCYLSQIHGKDQEFRHQGVEFICRKLLNPGAFFFLYKFIYLFIWLCWVFVSVRGLSLVAACGGHSSSPCAGLSPSRPLPLQSTSPRRAGSVVVAHGPSCSAVCGIFPDQGSNPCPLHWQADSQPLRHQGSPTHLFLTVFTTTPPQSHPKHSLLEHHILLVFLLPFWLCLLRFLLISPTFKGLFTKTHSLDSFCSQDFSLMQGAGKWSYS